MALHKEGIYVLAITICIALGLRVLMERQMRMGQLQSHLVDEEVERSFPFGGRGEMMATKSSLLLPVGPNADSSAGVGAQDSATMLQIMRERDELAETVKNLKEYMLHESARSATVAAASSSSSSSSSFKTGSSSTSSVKESGFRYWNAAVRSHPEDFPRALLNEKFLSFEPWNGGFNNIRQSLEIAASLAFALNRTLVFPPPWHMYLRGKSGLEDYFQLEDIKKGLPVIMYEDFHRLIGWKHPSGIEKGSVGDIHSCPLVAKQRPSDEVRVKYDSKGFSWSSAQAFCRMKGAGLCCAASVCDQGRPFFDVQDDDTWVPVLDEENDWVQVGKDEGYHGPPRTCQTHMDAHNEGPSWGKTAEDTGLKRYIVCCKKAKRHRSRRSLLGQKPGDRQQALAGDSLALPSGSTLHQHTQPQELDAGLGMPFSPEQRRRLLGQPEDYERQWSAPHPHLRRLLGQREEHDYQYGGIEFAPGVLLIDKNPNDNWYYDIFCIPTCPTHGPLKERFDKFNTKGDKEKLKLGKRVQAHHSVSDSSYKDARVIHFRQNLLGQFYQQLWFEDPQLEVATKRFVRDYIHFSDEVIAPAERVVEALGDKSFSCIHVRRGDFQYHQTRTSMQDILANTKALFIPGETIYIATDERNKAFFNYAKQQGYNITFWDDYNHLTKGTKGFIIPCSEMAVCSRARIFVGTQLSTFSGYIQRIRGYMMDQPHKEVYDTQTLFPNGYSPSWAEIWDHPTCGWCREARESWEGI